MNSGTFSFSLLSVIFLSGVVISSNAQNLPSLTCYSCTVSNPSDGDVCVTAPWNVTQGQPIIPCPNGWCTTHRQELTENLGKIWTFGRRCSPEAPTYPPEYLEKNAHQHNHFKWCRTNNCNQDNGIVKEGGGNNSSQSQFTTSLFWTAAIFALAWLSSCNHFD